MAMNQPNYFTGYPNYYPQPQTAQPYQYQTQLDQLRGMQAQQPQQPAVNQGLLWVQGEAGAKSYLVAPNSTVLLMDSEAQRFYLKSVDASGMPTMRTFEYTEVGQKPAQPVTDDFATRRELSDLYNRYSDLESQFQALVDRYDTLTAPRKPSVKKAVSEDG